jgi:hypothetical protein
VTRAEQLPCLESESFYVHNPNYKSF